MSSFIYRSPQGGPRRRITAAAAVGLMATAVGLSLGAEDDGVDAARAVIEKWQETRRIISSEKRDWAIGREVLEERIAIVADEIDELRGRIVETRENVTASEAKRAELAARNEALRAASAVLATSIGDLEARTRSLIDRLPRPIVDRVDPLARRLPNPDEPGDASLSERYANVIGILNEIDKFNREVHVVSESRTLASGATAVVEVMYVGLGHAYYVTEKRDAAGIGRPGPDGWTWTPVNQAADAVAQAIAVQKNEAPAAFTPLPIKMN